MRLHQAADADLSFRVATRADADCISALATQVYLKGTSNNSFVGRIALNRWLHHLAHPRCR